ncbi:MAG: M13 family metallopeptidase [Clostridiales bacterium]|nr:M13 family metallopeptidase [Clostridiales bacterium]
MKKMTAAVMAAVMVLPVLTGCGAAVIPSESSEETTVKELGPARAQDDYYRFINQERFDTAEFEYGEQSVEMAFDSKLIEEELNGIIEDVIAGDGYAKGSEEDIIKYAYESFMAYDFENEPIPDDLMAMIEEIDGVSSIDGLLEVDAKLVRDYDMDGLFYIYIDTDLFEPERRLISFSQISGILNTSFTDVRDYPYALDSIKEDTQVILSTRGYDKETAEKYGKELAYLAMDLYAETDLDIMEAEYGYDYVKVYSSAQIKEMLNNVDVDKYLSVIGIDASKADAFCLSDEKQLKALNSLLTEKNLNALKALELGNLYGQYSRYIAPHYPQLQGMVGRNYDSLHDQAIDEVRMGLKSETDPLYVERYYTPETDAALRGMCDDIRAGYRELISNADWLSEPTRKELLQKLENIVYVTGSNIKRHDNSKYTEVYGNNYYEFCRNYSKIAWRDLIAGLDEPVSRTDTIMEMQIFNACYDPSLNNITITVAITNAPFFDVNADYYTNLGGLGMVIAHEMGHAFDNNGILFNSKGEYDPSWIPDEDMKKLDERNEKAVRYFEDNFTVFGIYHVDGEQTLGENYADLGAMECITSLTKTKEDRINLFESYATIWCEMCTDETIIGLIAYDVHSPALIRVNAVLSTLEAFYETYGVSEGDGMYIAPEDRISRWY